MTIQQLHDRGFDLSTRVRQRVRVRCSQCAAVVVNGTPVHEDGCPHAVHECAGCNAIIPEQQRYCDECR